MATRKTKPDNYSGRGRYATRDSYPAPRTVLTLLLPETGTVDVITRHGATADLVDDGRPLGLYTEVIETMHILPGGSLGGFIK